MLMRKNKLICSKISLIFLMMISADLIADSAYSPEIVYTGDFYSNTRGGIKEGEIYLDNLDLALEIDVEKALGWTGGTFLAYVIVNNSNTLSAEIVGDAQGADNIDNTSVNRVQELWYEQAFTWGNSLKLGLYDINSEFDAIDPAGLFINSSHGIGPDYSQSGENGPSIFPASSLALRYFHPINDQFSFQTAVLDGVPQDPDDPHKNTIDISGEDGALLALEVNYQNSGLRLGLGGWHYTQKSKKNNQHFRRSQPRYLRHRSTRHNNSQYG